MAEVEAFARSSKGVKHLADSGVCKLPSLYVQSHPPPRAAAVGIPVIDLSCEHAHTIQQLNQACETWGFFQVVNHGIPEQVLRDMLQAGKEFFDMPFEERRAIFSDDVEQYMRFGTSHNPKKEAVLEWKDYLRHNFGSYDELPPLLDNYKRSAKPYTEAVEKLATRLYGLISEALGVDSGCISAALGSNPQATLIVNYYPPCPEPDLAIGISEHSDIGVLTLLLQNEVEGLEVFHPETKEWICVRPVEGALIVNLGDFLEIGSNGRYKSALHRGRVNSSKLRISVPAFMKPSQDALVRPFPELVSDENPAAYKSMTFAELFDLFYAHQLRGKELVNSIKLV